MYFNAILTKCKFNDNCMILTAQHSSNKQFLPMFYLIFNRNLPLEEIPEKNKKFREAVNSKNIFLQIFSNVWLHLSKVSCPNFTKKFGVYSLSFLLKICFNDIVRVRVRFVCFCGEFYVIHCMQNIHSLWRIYFSCNLNWSTIVNWSSMRDERKKLELFFIKST